MAEIETAVASLEAQLQEAQQERDECGWLMSGMLQWAYEPGVSDMTRVREALAERFSALEAIEREIGPRLDAAEQTAARYLELLKQHGIEVE